MSGIHTALGDHITTKKAVYSLVTIGAIGWGVAFLGQPALVRALSSLHVTRRPERVTELFFNNYHKPPVAVTPGSKQPVNFTVHNMQHERTAYRYELVAVLADGSTRTWDTGVFTLADTAARTVSQSVVIPPVAGRFAVQVNLSYTSTSAASSVPKPQKQSIHYWMDVAPAPKPAGGIHAGV